MSDRKELRYRAPIAGALAATFLIGVGGAQALCFKPLTDRSSHDPANWKGLSGFDPTDPVHPITKAGGVTNFLPIKGGIRDRINLDYYEMTFNAPAKYPTPAKFFQFLRGIFPVLARDQSQDYDFRPYRVSTDEMDLTSKRYQEIWDQAVPAGALMSFQLHVVTFGKSVGMSPKFVNGDVQATCATDTDFVFSTVETQEDGKHPVSGNRGFGLRANQDGTWTFYSMGADRESDFLPNKLNFSKHMDGKDTFQEGVAFWHSFYGQMTKVLEARGTAPRPLFENSCRYRFDPNLGPNGGASGNPVDCEPTAP